MPRRLFIFDEPDRFVAGTVGTIEREYTPVWNPTIRFEDGTISLIGATTENPYYEINSPLLSRMRVYRLEPVNGKWVASGNFPLETAAELRRLAAEEAGALFDLEHGPLIRGRVRHGDIAAVTERDGWKLDVGRRQRRIRIVRHSRETRRQRQQMLALVVEHVLLLAIEILDREPVDGKLGIARHPGPDRVERNGQQLRAEP